MSEMTRTADNILTRLWNSYKKEHPNAKAPPQSLKDKAKDLAGEGDKKKEKKPAPKPKDGIKQEHDEDGIQRPVHPSHDPNFSETSAAGKKLLDSFKGQVKDYKAEKAKSDEAKKSPDQKREEKAKKVMDSAGFKDIEDATNKMDAMRAELHKMSDADKKSPAGKLHRKKMDTLGEAVSMAGKLSDHEVKAINSDDADMKSPKYQKEVKGMEDDILKSLEKYNALGEEPKGMSDALKGLVGKGKALADKLMKSLKGKKASRVLAAHRGIHTASTQGDMVLARRMIRLAHARPELRAHLLPLVVDYLASKD